MRVGIDIEQFVRDPYGSGIQRVLQYLAKEWPEGDLQAEFVVPIEEGHGRLSPAQAAELLTVPFIPRQPRSDLRALVNAHLDGFGAARIAPDELLADYDCWLLPEVTYLPTVLERFARFAERVPTAMIGYDTLPMSDPANYRFRPGAAAHVSEYFRQLATTDAVVCISDYARDSILSRLRRDPGLPITVAYPGGDHVVTRPSEPPQRPVFARLGTLEARKRPVELLDGFAEAVTAYGVEADLLFMGSPSASDEGINRAVRTAIDDGLPVRWVTGGSDVEVADLVHESSAFLSFGIEGYGIPVLEAIRLGTPVLYDGIQPAGDLMRGHGARRVDGGSRDALVAMFESYARQDALAGLRGELDSEAVPIWADFATEVARNCGSVQ